MTAGMVRLSMDLPPHTQSVALARRFTEFACRMLGSESVVDTASLLVSELVGNAIRYATNEVRVTAWSMEGGRLRMEVHDDGSGHPRTPRIDDPLRTTGRGLLIVDELADAWHVLDTGRGGKTVWFELRSRQLQLSGVERRSRRD